MDRPRGYSRESFDDRYPNRQGGHQNSGYSPDRKGTHPPPPAYEDHMRQHQGMKGGYPSQIPYQSSQGRRHHDLSANFPAQRAQHDKGNQNYNYQY